MVSMIAGCPAVKTGSVSSYRHFLREADELLRRIHLDAQAFSRCRESAGTGPGRRLDALTAAGILAARPARAPDRGARVAEEV
jgi:hypothetical protein